MSALYFSSRFHRLVVHLHGQHASHRHRVAQCGFNATLTVLPYPTDLIPQGVQRRGKRGPSPSGNRLSGAEKSRRYRQRRAEEKRRKAEEKRET
jgi:hypothetical protein